MKKLLLSLTAIAMFAVACAQAPSKSVTIEKFAGERITGIDFGGAATINITQGSVGAFKFTVPENIKNQFTIILDNDGTVEIKRNNNFNNNNNERCTIDMVCVDLREVDVSGAAKVNLIGAINASEVSIDGSGAINLQSDNLMVAGKLDIDVSGSAKINVVGKAYECEIDASGAADIEMTKFPVNRMDIEISGAGNAKVNVTNFLKAEISGAGKIGYLGSPQIQYEDNLTSKIYKL